MFRIALLDDLRGDLFEALSCLPEPLKLQHEANILRRGNEYVPRHTFQLWSMSLIDAMMALVILVSSMVSQLECCETELSILEDSVQNDLQTAWTQKIQLQAPCHHLSPNTFFARIGVSLAISGLWSQSISALYFSCSSPMSDPTLHQPPNTLWPRTNNHNYVSSSVKSCSPISRS
jgi:hypothetical protein